MVVHLTAVFKPSYSRTERHRLSSSFHAVKRTYTGTNSKSELSDLTRARPRLLPLLCPSQTPQQNQTYPPFWARLDASPQFGRMDSPQYTKSTLPSLLSDPVKHVHLGILHTIQYHCTWHCLWSLGGRYLGRSSIFRLKVPSPSSDGSP